MSVFEYKQLLRFISCGVFSFFAYQAFAALHLHRKRNSKATLWHGLMCLVTSFYCVTLFISTYSFQSLSGDLILSVAWIVGFIGYFCYLQAMRYHLNLAASKLSLARACIFILVGSHTIGLFQELALESNHWLLRPITDREQTLFEQALRLKHTMSIYGYLSVLIGSTAILSAAIIIWKKLSKMPGNELLFKTGIIITVIAAVNDTALGAGIIGSMLPTYYIANFIEAIRLHLHQTEQTHDEINRLNKENTIAKIEAIEGQRFHKLLRTISHDINNSLSVILASVDLGELKPESQEVTKKCLTRIGRASNNIANIIATVLDKAASQKNINDMELEVIDVAKVFEEISFLFAEKIENKSIVINMNQIPKEASFLGNTTILINQIIANILSNAIKFSPAGSTITIDHFVDDQMYNIIIKDTGEGIDLSTIRDIKNRKIVKSTNGSAGEIGHGFGLLILHENVSQLGGDIKYANDNGTRVSLAFPKIQVGKVA